MVFRSAARRERLFGSHRPTTTLSLEQCLAYAREHSPAIEPSRNGLKGGERVVVTVHINLDDGSLVRPLNGN